MIEQNRTPVKRFGPRGILLFLFFIAWSGFFVFLNWSADYAPSTDDVDYLLIGRGFVEGTGFKDPSIPWPQNIFYVPTAFPLFLSIYWKLFSPHLQILNLMMAVLTIAGGWLSFLWLSKLLPTAGAFLLTMAFSATEMFILFSTTQKSESLFMVLLYGGLLLYSMERRNPSKAWAGWSAMVLWTMLARTRVVGIPFFLVYLFMDLHARKWKRLFAALFLISIWLVFEKVNRLNLMSSEGYLVNLSKQIPLLEDPLGALLVLAERFYHDSTAFVGAMYGQILFQWFYHLHPMNPFKRILVVGVFITALYGLYLFWKTRPEWRPWVVALLISLGPVFTWWPTGTIFRYLAPFFPWMTLFFVFPFCERLPPPRFKWVPLLIASLIVINQALYTLRDRSLSVRADDQQDFRRIHAFVLQMNPRPEMIFSPQPKYAHLRTGLYALSIRRATDWLNVPMACARFSCVGIFSDASSDFIGQIRCDSLEITVAGSPQFRAGRWGLFSVECKKIVKERCLE